MNYRFWTILLAASFVGAMLYACGVFSDGTSSLTPSALAADEEKKPDQKKADDKKDDEKKAGPPPLVVDKSTPLLLDEPPEVDPFAPPEGPRADNSACFVCHTNYDEEPFAVIHAKANVGCIKCHGESLDHRNDEDNITPPDIMFPADKIAAKCAKCHDEHDVPAVKVIALWQAKCPEKTDAKTIVCTDCHGNHRLTHRTVRWNKATGEILAEEKEGSAEKECSDKKKCPAEKDSAAKDTAAPKPEK